MPTSIIKRLSPFEGVVPGQRATLEMPIGPRHKKLILIGTIKPPSGGTATLSMIMGMIILEINNNANRQILASELAALLPLNGLEFSYTYENITDPGTAPDTDDTIRYKLSIPFEETFRKSYEAADMMSLPTVWENGERLGSLQVHVDVPLTTGATLHALRATIEYDNQLGKVDANGNSRFFLSKWWRNSITYTAAGERYIVSLPKKDAYQSMHFFTQSGDPITNMKIIVDNREIMDVTKEENDDFLVRHGIPAAALSDDRFDVIFDRDDKPDSFLNLNGVKDFQVIPTLGNAAASSKIISLITQVYGPRD